MTRPARTVSVIIPTYNRADSLPEALETVLGQVPAPDEVIVVDDGSQDNTREVMADYGNRIVAIHQENAGAAAARNAGMARATGDWLAFLDSDDLWRPGRMAALHRDLDAAKEGVVAHTGDMQMTGAGYDEALFAHRGWVVPKGHAERMNLALPRTLSGLPLPTTAVERTAALACGALPEEMPIYEDLAFLSKLALRGAWLFTGDVMAQARRLDGDEIALSSIERHRPLETARLHAAFMCNLLEQKMTPEARALTARHTSGALLRLAEAEAESDPVTARQSLWRSARVHPQKIKGFLKILPPLLLGKRGYGMVLRDRSGGFSRA